MVDDTNTNDVRFRMCGTAQPRIAARPLGKIPPDERKWTMETITAPTPLIAWMDGYASRTPGGRYRGKCRHPQSTLRIAAMGTSDDRFSLRECALCGSRAWFSRKSNRRTDWIQE
jgi:hypothetical protein